MHGMVVHAFVLHDETISLAGLQVGGVGRSRVLRIAETVDPPEFFVAMPLEFGVEDQLDCLCVWMSCGIARGVVSVPSTRWPKLAIDGNSVNMLTSQRLTDKGGGPTFYSCLVQVERIGD